MAVSDMPNHQVVTLAVHRLGGASKAVDTEDVAVEVNRLAPGRYTWKKHPDQINLEIVRVYCSDAKKAEKGKLLIGSGTDGWMLTPAGLAFARQHAGVSAISAPSGVQAQMSRAKPWYRNEEVRLTGSEAFQKYSGDNADAATSREILAFFRLDSYVVGPQRSRRIARVVNAFGDHPELGEAVRHFAAQLEEE